MTSKEFYADFFGVKNPNEQGTTLNISVWKYAEAYAKALNQWQKLPMAGVVKSCGSCHYSDNGNHGCNRLMKGVEPEIDITKGIDCA